MREKRTNGGGIIVAFLIVCATAAISGAANLAVNSGFETSEVTYGYWPSTYGDWAGDYSAIEGATDGVTPYEGSKMLKFFGTSWNDSGPGSTSQVYQIIDVSTYRSLISSNQAIATVSGYFNRVAGDAETDTAFDISIYAYQGDISSFPTQLADGTHLAAGSNVLYSDSNPATWQMLEAQLLLPTNTDFITIGLIANENIFNDVSYPEFDGHFADGISAEIVPEPLSALLLGIGAIVLHNKQRQYRRYQKKS